MANFEKQLAKQYGFDIDKAKQYATGNRSENNFTPEKSPRDLSKSPRSCSKSPVTLGK